VTLQVQRRYTRTLTRTFTLETKSDIRGFGRGAVKWQKSFPPVPLTTQVERNDAQTRRPDEPPRFSGQIMSRLNPAFFEDFFSDDSDGILLDFQSKCLDWKRIQSETSPKESDSKRRPRLYSSAGKFSIGNSRGRGTFN